MSKFVFNNTNNTLLDEPSSLANSINSNNNNVINSHNNSNNNSTYKELKSNFPPYNSVNYTEFEQFWDLKEADPSYTKSNYNNSKYESKTYSAINLLADRITLYTTKKGVSYSSKFSDFNKQDLINDLKTDTVWIDINNPSELELQIISNTFNVHHLSIEDIMTQETREKCEVFTNYYFINFKSFDASDSNNFLNPLNMYLLLCNNNVLFSFHYSNDSNSHVESAINRLLQNIDDRDIIDAWFIKYILIDDITDSYAPLLSIIETEVDSIDDLVLILKESDQSDMLRRIGYARKKVTLLLRLLSSKTDVIKGIVSRIDKADSKHKGLKVYYNDIQDHLVTMVQNSIHYEKVLSRAYSNYLAQISIDLTQTSNKTNDVVAKLTALASILLPMNVITGLWGMNVKVPGQDRDDLLWFFGILGFMFLLGFIVFVLVKRSGIL